MVNHGVLSRHPFFQRDAGVPFRRETAETASRSGYRAGLPMRCAWSAFGCMQQLDRLDFAQIHKIVHGVHFHCCLIEASISRGV